MATDFEIDFNRQDPGKKIVRVGGVVFYFDTKSKTRSWRAACCNKPVANPYSGHKCNRPRLPKGMAVKPARQVSTTNAEELT